MASQGVGSQVTGSASPGVVGLIAPGQMGAAVGAAVTTSRPVLWASEGRGEDSRRRADAAGLADVGDLASLVARSDVLLSVCPPGAAVDVATAVAALDFSGIYVDANAIAPRTGETVAAIVQPSASYVDAGLIGPPPHEAGTTRLYLSGDRAADVTGLFDGGPLEAIDLGLGPTAASALKVCYAAYTKGAAALLLDVWALAAAHGVDGALRGEWRQSIPRLAEEVHGTARRQAPKAWRFVDEMVEVADTFDAAGLPDGFHRAAAELFDRLRHHKDAEDAVTLDEVVADLRSGR